MIKLTENFDNKIFQQKVCFPLYQYIHHLVQYLHFSDILGAWKEAKAAKGQREQGRKSSKAEKA